MTTKAEEITFRDELLRIQRESIAMLEGTVASLNRSLGHMEDRDKMRLEFIEALFRIFDRHGIEHPPLSPEFKLVMHEGP
jgi:hypothetical protein